MALDPSVSTESTTIITISFSTSTGGHTLSSSNTSVAQISSDKKSFTYKGKTYTPTVSKTSKTTYTLVSYKLATGSQVGTDNPSSTSLISINKSSDYTSGKTNYYTTVYSYDYEYASLSLSSSTGTVSGDTSYATYSTVNNGTTTYGSWTTNSAAQKYAYTGPNKTLTGDSEFYSVTWNSTGISDGTNTNYKVKSATALTVELSDTERWYPASSASVSGSIGSETIVATFYKQTRTKTTNNNYSFSSVSWNSSITVGSYTYSLYSSSGGSGSTSASATYRRSTTSYNPDIYSTFTFHASSGTITWSHTGTGSTNSTYTSKIEDNATFNIESEITYTHTSTNWGSITSHKGYVESTDNRLVLLDKTIGWSFTDKDGNVSEGSTIKFVDKNGNETEIEGLGE